MDHEDTSLPVTNPLVRDIDLRLQVIREEGMCDTAGVGRLTTNEQRAE